VAAILRARQPIGRERAVFEFDQRVQVGHARGADVARRSHGRPRAQVR
jgi:hypothetical protein